MKQALRKFAQAVQKEEELIELLISLGNEISTQWEWDNNLWNHPNPEERVGSWSSNEGLLTLYVCICEKPDNGINTILLKKSSNQDTLPSQWALHIATTSNLILNNSLYTFFKKSFEGYYDLNSIEDIQKARELLYRLEHFLSNEKDIKEDSKNAQET